MRADDRGDEAVEVPAHRDFLGRRLGVEVHEDDPRALAHRFDLAFDHDERVVDVQHEDASHAVDDADRLAVARPCDVTTVARRAGRIVGRAEQPRLDPM